MLSIGIRVQPPFVTLIAKLIEQDFGSGRLLKSSCVTDRYKQYQYSIVFV